MCVGNVKVFLGALTLGLKVSVSSLADYLPVASHLETDSRK